MILRSPEHQSIFPNPKGQLPTKVRYAEWSTKARLEFNDAQASFMAMGLSSGFVGSGADTLLQDDPYQSAEKARSAKIRDTTWRFQTETAAPRLRENSNNFIMFHRYPNDDQGGRAIANGFELWRYAAIADDVYEDEDTGRQFPCFPVGRPEGAFLSDRYPKWYYDLKMKDQDLGINFEITTNLPVDDGINAGRLMFNQLWIDETNCSFFLDAIAQYRGSGTTRKGCSRRSRYTIEPVTRRTCTAMPQLQRTE